MALVTSRPSLPDESALWGISELSLTTEQPLPTAPDFMDLFKSYHATVSQKQTTALEKFNHKQTKQHIHHQFAELRYFQTKIQGWIYKRLRREQCLTVVGVQFISEKVINFTNWRAYFDLNGDVKKRREWLRGQFELYYTADLEDVFVLDESKPCHGEYDDAGDNEARAVKAIEPKAIESEAIESEAAELKTSTGVPTL